ncbi:MAG TPA: DUF192 domain-containing protein [Rhizomicrobium sp.]|jgi:hypothetical protein|nr:DUF192 domain-containing protein [Rhizomicrobium sp.]
MRLRLAVLVLIALTPLSFAAKLPVQTVTIQTQSGARVFHMEIAADDATRATGLMHRTHLSRDAGMLFDFRTTVMTAFWMKDTPIPLDMLFVRPDGTIASVAANAVPLSTAEIAAPEPVRAVIEINGGEAKALGIMPGDRVMTAIFPKPPSRR